MLSDRDTQAVPQRNEVQTTLRNDTEARVSSDDPVKDSSTGPATRPFRNCKRLKLLGAVGASRPEDVVSSGLPEHGLKAPSNCYPAAPSGESSGGSPSPVALRRRLRVRGSEGSASPVRQRRQRVKPKRELSFEQEKVPGSQSADETSSPHVVPAQDGTRVAPSALSPTPRKVDRRLKKVSDEHTARFRRLARTRKEELESEASSHESEGGEARPAFVSLGNSEPVTLKDSRPLACSDESSCSGAEMSVLERRPVRPRTRRQGKRRKGRACRSEFMTVTDLELRWPSRPETQKRSGSGSECDELEQHARKKQAVQLMKDRLASQVSCQTTLTSDAVDMRQMKSTLLAPTLSFDIHKPILDDSDEENHGLVVDVPQNHPHRDSRRDLLREQLRNTASRHVAERLRCDEAEELVAEPSVTCAHLTEDEEQDSVTVNLRTRRRTKNVDDNDLDCAEPTASTPCTVGCPVEAPQLPERCPTQDSSETAPSQRQLTTASCATAQPLEPPDLRCLPASFWECLHSKFPSMEEHNPSQAIPAVTKAVFTTQRQKQMLLSELFLIPHDCKAKSQDGSTTARGAPEADCEQPCSQAGRSAAPCSHMVVSSVSGQVEEKVHCTGNSEDAVHGAVEVPRLCRLRKVQRDPGCRLEEPGSVVGHTSPCSDVTDPDHCESDRDVGEVCESDFSEAPSLRNHAAEVPLEPFSVDASAGGSERIDRHLTYMEERLEDKRRVERRLQWEIDDALEISDTFERAVHLGTATMSKEDRAQWKKVIGCAATALPVGAEAFSSVRAANCENNDTVKAKLVGTRCGDDGHLYSFSDVAPKTRSFLATKVVRSR